MSKSKVTVYTARKVRTMDPGRPEVEAVAVLDGKVLSTGTMESMQPWLEHYHVTVDDTFKGKVIMPGFIKPWTMLHRLKFISVTCYLLLNNKE